jgi:hypothetical protein
MIQARLSVDATAQRIKDGCWKMSETLAAWFAECADRREIGMVFRQIRKKMNLEKMNLEKRRISRKK